RMTAAIGHPTLRLIRVQIGELELNGLAPGHWRELGAGERARVFAGRPRSEAKVNRDGAKIAKNIQEAKEGRNVAGNVIRADFLERKRIG
ncbi:MAG: hypothetical protein ABIP20_21065, partial [Chthoniobacteraceae bacterium]